MQKHKHLTFPLIIKNKNKYEVCVVCVISKNDFFQGFEKYIK